MKNLIAFAFLLLFSHSINLSAQQYLEAPQYAVHFKDKQNTPYSVENPLAYLSQKAIDRRAKFSIAITEADLPVDPFYVERIITTGAHVRNTSRWSNSVLVYADDAMLDLIQKFDFVEKIVYVKPAEGKCKPFEIHPKWMNAEVNNDYGYALAQIEQLNGIPVHQQGYTGEGVIIAVLDGGFQKANEVAGLAHLFQSGRIVLERNVVEPDRSIYDENISNHGTMVLSCMGGYLAEEYTGTAPHAAYALIRTEDTPTEYLIEEYFWMIGAEVADSLGADIINSSLSYKLFDDPSMDHDFTEMDGKTAISSIAAKMAVERGIFVCNSAGNSNGTASPWVGSPADVPEALSLGAVNLEGEIAYFSSIGPNGAGYPKPDVVACGWGAYVIHPDNTIGTASGTSFSSPITCGMVACIIGATPNKKPDAILKAIQKSADRYPEHDIQYGYGIPDFGKVLSSLDISSYENTNGSKLIYYPNPVNDKLYLSNDDHIIKSVELYDVAGKLVKNVNPDAHHTFVNVKEISKGFLFVKVTYKNNSSEIVKCMIIR